MCVPRLRTPIHLSRSPSLPFRELLAPAAPPASTWVPACAGTTCGTQRDCDWHRAGLRALLLVLLVDLFVFGVDDLLVLAARARAAGVGTLVSFIGGVGRRGLLL